MTGTNEDIGPDADRGDIGEDEPQAFILSRARSEVHLLLDNISANPDVTMASLTAAAPPESKGLSADWIEKICEITWPRPQGEKDGDELADQAALLIRTKDYLNGLAKPASGATIAFTLMVTQEETPKTRRRRAKAGAVRTPSRTSLAAEAYPDLVDKARDFRRLLSVTLSGSVGALAFTLLLSWYLAVGNAALSDYAATFAALAEADARVSAAQSALNGDDDAQPATVHLPVPPPSARTASTAAAPRPAQAGSVAAAASPAALPKAAAAASAATATTTTAPTYLLHPCRRDTRDQFYSNAGLRDACFARQIQADHWLAVRAGLRTWALGMEPDTARWLANLLGSGVLPVLYGFLGAIASVVRTLSRKIRASLLSPRDVQLTFQQLALGTVVGACISLFIAAPSGGYGDQASLLGPVALSGSAIAFVAGFGVDSVFQALEALISRIFNIAPAGGPSRREARTGS